MAFILVGVYTDVPITGSNAPSRSDWAWDIYDHQTSTVVDGGPTIGVDGANGWKFRYNPAVGDFQPYPPLTADATGAADRYEYRTNGALGS